jgi:hydrogenase/urease accessory protein HupE
MKHKLFYLVLFIFSLQSSFAHEVRPAYLEINQTSAETYDVLWKLPALGETMYLALYVDLPKHCVNITKPRTSMINNSYTKRWSVKCNGGIGGETIRIVGLSGIMTDVLVRIVRLDGSTQIARITASSPMLEVSKNVKSMDVIQAYTLLGIKHILIGIDHLLFVLALIIITRGGWKLFTTVTAFTIAHSISLALSTLGYIHFPIKPVEAIIALSIVFVASEIMRERKSKLGITSRAPWLVALTFGLMHGLGFASGLSETGLPDGHIPTALLFFSIGVELGHFLFIGFVLLLMAIMKRIISKLEPARQQQLSMLSIIPPYIIGSVAMFWVIERILSF